MVAAKLPRRTSTMPQNILVETEGRVGIIRFNRPQALNALNAALVEELNAAIDAVITKYLGAESAA